MYQLRSMFQISSVLSLNCLQGDFFLKKNFWRAWVLFVGPLIPLFWTSGDISSGFQSQGGQPYLHLAKAYVLHVPWDSPLVWHLLDLLVTSMVAEPSLPRTCEELVGLKTRSCHAAAHSVRSGRPDALPTELSKETLTFNLLTPMGII